MDKHDSVEPPDSVAARLGEAILRAAPDAIVYADREGRIRFWNAGAERVFGFTEAEALGQSLDIIIPERQRQRHWDGYDKVMATGESRYGHGDVLSVPGVRKDGGTVSCRSVTSLTLTSVCGVSW